MNDTKINWNEYQQRVLSYGKRPSDRERIIHATLGLCGECSELADVILLLPSYNEFVIDELGDVCWYVALMADTAGLPMDTVAKRFPVATIDTVTVDNVTAQTMRFAGALANRVKKQYCITGVEQPHLDLIPSEVTVLLALILRNVRMLAQYIDVSMPIILETNVAKIERRHMKVEKHSVSN